MRLKPTDDQMKVDSLAWSDGLRVLFLAGPDDTFTFVRKVIGMNWHLDNYEKPSHILAKAMESQGIRWKGKFLQKQTVLLLDHMAPYVDCPSVINALEKVKPCFKDIETFTTLGKCC